MAFLTISKRITTCAASRAGSGRQRGNRGTDTVFQRAEKYGVRPPISSIRLEFLPFVLKCLPEAHSQAMLPAEEKS